MQMKFNQRAASEKGHEDLCVFSPVSWTFNLSDETDLKTFEKGK